MPADCRGGVERCPSAGLYAKEVLPMFMRHLLQDSDVAALADAALEILDRVGVLCQNEEMLDAYAAWGARVDRAAERVTLPRALVERFAAALREESRARTTSQAITSPSQRFMASPKDVGEEQPAEYRYVAPRLPGIGTQVAQFYYDDETGEKRGGTRADLIRLTKLGEVLHRDAGVGHCLVIREVPPMVEPIEAGMVLAEYATNPGAPFAWNVRQVPYLREMGQVLGIDEWFTLGADCISHPLRFDRDVADRMVLKAKLGHAVGLTGMEVAGASTPVTTAGFVAVSAAEFMAAWIVARAINPSVPLGGDIWAATIDMRNGDVSFSSQDAMFRGIALTEFLRRWTGIQIAVGGGEYSAARHPSLYASLEKARKAMTIAAFTGRHPGIGDGMVETGRTISAVQLLLDREFTEEAGFLGERIDCSPEAIGLDTIIEVGFGLTTNHLSTEHTLRHFRANAWMPRIADRRGYEGCTTDEAVVARARKRVQELLGQYVKPDRDPAVLQRLQSIVERARRELV